jgi:hypothetical protein
MALSRFALGRPIGLVVATAVVAEEDECPAVKRNRSVNATRPLPLRPSPPKPSIALKSRSVSTTRAMLDRMNLQIQSVIEKSALRIGSENGGLG